MKVFREGANTYTQWIVFFAMLLLGCVPIVFITLAKWRSFKQMHNRCFNYSITDIWAATFALMPSLFLLAFNFNAELKILPFLSFILLGQITGCFIGKLDSELIMPCEQSWASAIRIVSSSLFYGAMSFIWISIVVGFLALLFLDV